MSAHNDDVAFVHIPKHAGHSCREYMLAHLDGVVDFDEARQDSFGHLALRDWEKFIGRPPDTYNRIIAVIRNPYKQQVSQWLFWKDRFARGFRLTPYEHAALHCDLTHWLLDPMCDWHIYDPRTRDGKQKTTAGPNGYPEFGGYYPYWLAVDGEIPDNVTLVRFESLGTDFPLALEDLAGGCYDMPRSNAGPMKGLDTDTEHYYSELAQKMVEEKFAWCFRHGLYERWGAVE